MSTLRQWRDRKRYWWPLGLLIPLSPFLSWLLVEHLPPGTVLGHRSMDSVACHPDRRPDRRLTTVTARPKALSQRCRKIGTTGGARTCIFPLQYSGLVFACWCWVHAPMATGERIALAMTVGVVAGVGIDAAHELGHKARCVQPVVGENGPGPIVVRADTSTSSTITVTTSGWRRRRTRPVPGSGNRFGCPTPLRGGGPAIGMADRNSAPAPAGETGSGAAGTTSVQAWAFSVALFAILIAVFGWQILPVATAASIRGDRIPRGSRTTWNITGSCGLAVEDGSFIKARPEDSWNSDHLVSNLFLYQLQRHSDHHANPRLRYQSLRSAPTAPQLPAGYAVMIVCAWIPPVWRRIMDHRVLDYYNGNVELIHTKATI